MVDKEIVLARVRTMAKVTSKLQVTIPKVVADAHGIRPGAELSFESAGDVIRIHVVGEVDGGNPDDLQQRLASFDRATARQALRNRWFRKHHRELIEAGDRGWRREELYDRGLAR
jgi:bifunctional DNA-binding transcriptional regulator/antitoxin component of YhaV-PrlF toxin-antitoxin module